MFISKQALLAAAVSVAALGCGSSSPNTPSPPANGGPSVTVNVVGDAYRPGGSAAFTPGVVTIDRGTTVSWLNQDQTAHNTTANNGAWSGTIPAADSFSRVFNTSGTFEYRCSLHPGMEGTVTVR